MKIVPPSIRETAFNCPHCLAFTTQFWSNVYNSPIDKGNPTPYFPDKETEEKILTNKNFSTQQKKSLIDFFSKIKSGEIFIRSEESSSYLRDQICNLFLSKCFNCKKISIWAHDKLVYPPQQVGPIPNPDLPDDIIKDYKEASSILSLSPRGAAALLRLCIQKLCIVLGEKGKSIDDDIASLVTKGLNPIIKQSLDIVRVVGNEAVHPGVIELNDDREIANQLFDLVNAIADQMLSHPKKVHSMYTKLPVEKREAIERRDAKALAKSVESN